jgi:hypothetical protein
LEETRRNSIKREVVTPKASKGFKKESSRNKSGYCGYSDNNDNKESSEKVDRKLRGVNDQLVEAIRNYSGPDIKITSGLRHSGYRRSLHRVGKALDLHYNEEFIMWCETDKGKSWLKEYNLEFFVEDYKSSTKETLPDDFIKFWRLVP